MSLTDYFNRTAYKAKYSIGDRVRGFYNGIPISGTVGNDTLINEEIGPRISIHLDLPLKENDMVRNIIFVKHDDIDMLEKVAFKKAKKK